MHEQQDEDIIKLVLQGNEQAYAILVERYSHFVFTLATRILPNEEDAKEAAQDTFVKAHQSLATYRGGSKFSTWLYTITRNVCISKSRTNRHSKHLSYDDLSQVTHLSESSINQHEQASRKKLLHHAISLLPADDAQIISLFYIHEQTLEEICTIVDITSSNAKVRLYRARKKLKEILDNHFSDELTEYNKTIKPYQ